MIASEGRRGALDEGEAQRSPRTSDASPAAASEPPPSRHALAFLGLTFAWGERSVIDDLTLAIGPSEHVALLGPNGSGKSTLLRLAAGLLRPRAGTITRAADVGVVFQQPSLDLSLTCRDNLELAAQIQGLDRKTAKLRAVELLTLVGLAERTKSVAKELSGGMRRRLDLARALVAEPALLLLDEPTSGLDADQVERFWEHVQATRRLRPLAIVTATHRGDEAERADRLVMLNHGKIVAEGTPRDVLHSFGHDLLIVRARRPDEIAGLVTGKLGLVARVVGDEVTLEVPADTDAAQTLVRVVELFPAGRLDAIVMRRPSLGDAFAKLAGMALDGAQVAA